MALDVTVGHEAQAAEHLPLGKTLAQRQCGAHPLGGVALALGGSAYAISQLTSTFLMSTTMQPAHASLWLRSTGAGS